MNAPPAGPCTMVIFGASGDLTRRLLIPALYNLEEAGLLSAEFRVLGVARAPRSSDDFRAQLGHDLEQFATAKVDQALWDDLARRIEYLEGSFEDPETYRKIQAQLAPVDSPAGNYLFYLATAPDQFGVVAQQLHTAGLSTEPAGHWRRLVVEKPFGHDLASARDLNAQLLSGFQEQQIYRIDHYLGKETVQNILVMRFANGFFEPLWNRDHIDHVQISVCESVGVENRGGYYDRAGALRDMVPNHLFQLLALIAMEPPTCFSADAVRLEKTKLLQALETLTPETVKERTVRAQYGPGESGVAYRKEAKVAADSTTETFVALKLTIDNWRWAGVPFYLRTGKALKERRTEIAIRFKQAPYAMFRGLPVQDLPANHLVLHLQPLEQISLHFGVKIPGPLVLTEGVDMDFCYNRHFGGGRAIGYETLLYDCMVGDATLFQRSDTVEAAWSAVEPILQLWGAGGELPEYPAGSEGPAAAAALLEHDGRHWWRPDDDPRG